MNENNRPDCFAQLRRELAPNEDYLLTHTASNVGVYPVTKALCISRGWDRLVRILPALPWLRRRGVKGEPLSDKLYRKTP